MTHVSLAEDQSFLHVLVWRIYVYSVLRKVALHSRLLQFLADWLSEVCLSSKIPA